MVGRWVEQIFLAVLQMGLAGTFCIAAVFAARLFLKKSPRIFSYALWGVAFFRLACPAPFESPVSLYGLAGDGFAEVRQGLAEDFLAQELNNLLIRLLVE